MPFLSLQDTKQLFINPHLTWSPEQPEQDFVEKLEQLAHQAFEQRYESDNLVEEIDAEESFVIIITNPSKTINDAINKHNFYIGHLKIILNETKLKKENYAQILDDFAHNESLKTLWFEWKDGDYDSIDSFIAHLNKIGLDDCFRTLHTCILDIFSNNMPMGYYGLFLDRLTGGNANSRGIDFKKNIEISTNFHILYLESVIQYLQADRSNDTQAFHVYVSKENNQIIEGNTIDEVKTIDEFERLLFAISKLRLQNLTLPLAEKYILSLEKKYISSTEVAEKLAKKWASWFNESTSLEQLKAFVGRVFLQDNDDANIIVPLDKYFYSTDKMQQLIREEKYKDARSLLKNRVDIDAKQARYDFATWLVVQDDAGLKVLALSYLMPDLFTNDLPEMKPFKAAFARLVGIPFFINNDSKWTDIFVKKQEITANLREEIKELSEDSQAQKMTFSHFFCSDKTRKLIEKIEKMELPVMTADSSTGAEGTTLQLT